jgi:hypothetical protein
MGTSVVIPKDEYDVLKKKAEFFDQYLETEDLSSEEIAKVKDALKGPFLTKAEFLKRHQDLA